MIDEKMLQNVIGGAKRKDIALGFTITLLSIVSLISTVAAIMSIGYIRSKKNKQVYPNPNSIPNSTEADGIVSAAIDQVTQAEKKVSDISLRLEQESAFAVSLKVDMEKDYNLIKQQLVTAQQNYYKLLSYVASFAKQHEFDKTTIDIRSQYGLSVFNLFTILNEQFPDWRTKITLNDSSFPPIHLSRTFE